MNRWKTERQPIFSGKYKTLMILDDLEYKFMPRAQLRHLDRLYGSIPEQMISYLQKYEMILMQGQVWQK